MVAALYPLFYKMDSLIDSYGLLSQYGSLYSEKGRIDACRPLGSIVQSGAPFFEHKTDTTVAADFAMPPETQDGLAVFYMIRGRAFKPGERLTIPVADSGALYTTQVDVGARLESVRVPHSETMAWKLNVSLTDADNQPVWKNVALWISNDERRLPVKMQAELPVGAFVLALRQAR